MQKILIVGGVAGGATAAARLRRNDETAEIIVFERGEYISYANCGLPYHISAHIPDRNHLILQSEEGFYERYNVDVRLESEVISINPDEKYIEIKELNTGDIYREIYDKLLLSPGSNPIKPPIEGIESDRIFCLRTIPDMDRIKRFIERELTDKKNSEERSESVKAVVIGAGFIGMEMVENLNMAGIDVTVVEKRDQVMAPLDYTMASIVHRHLEEKRIELIFEDEVVKFETTDDHVKLSMLSGKSLKADFVILSIGVRPEITLARSANLAIGQLGGILVDEYMQTSDPDIYAIGDAVEIYNPSTGRHALTPLAGPANKQARIAANNIIEGNLYKYPGSIGTAIAKIFDLTVASTGTNSKQLNRENISHITSFTHDLSHAGYYPGADQISIRINFTQGDGRLLGAQVIGRSGVDKRIDIFSQVIKSGGTILDLQQFEHAYAPPYSSAKDPVNNAGYVAENILTGRMAIIHVNELSSIPSDEIVIIDVRTKGEYADGHISGAINIPVDELRRKLADIPRGKSIVTYCAVGKRGYIAYRILVQNGFNKVYNLSGGYRTYIALKPLIK